MLSQRWGWYSVIDLQARDQTVSGAPDVRLYTHLVAELVSCGCSPSDWQCLAAEAVWHVMWPWIIIICAAAGYYWPHSGKIIRLVASLCVYVSIHLSWALSCLNCLTLASLRLYVKVVGQRSRSNSENCLRSPVWTSGMEQVDIRTRLAEFSQL